MFITYVPSMCSRCDESKMYKIPFFLQGTYSLDQSFLRKGG